MKFELDSLENQNRIASSLPAQENIFQKKGFLILLVSGSPSPYLTCQGIDSNVADGLVTQFFIKNIGAGNV